MNRSIISGLNIALIRKINLMLFENMRILTAGETVTIGLLQSPIEMVQIDNDSN